MKSFTPLSEESPPKSLGNEEEAISENYSDDAFDIEIFLRECAEITANGFTPTVPNEASNYSADVSADDVEIEGGDGTEDIPTLLGPWININVESNPTVEVAYVLDDGASGITGHDVDVYGEPQKAPKRAMVEGDAGNFHETSLADLDWPIDMPFTLASSGQLARFHEDVVTALANISSRLDQLEARFSSASGLLQENTAVRHKRKRSPATLSPSKKHKTQAPVHIMATRAFIEWDDDSDLWEYAWQRGLGGRCWVREMEFGKREEIDGGYLLCCASELSIEVRANADWLPIIVRWNHKEQVFEGRERIGRRRLIVDEKVMMAMLCGDEGEYFGKVTCH